MYVPACISVYHMHVVPLGQKRVVDLWNGPAISVLRKQRQEDVWSLQVSLGNTAKSILKGKDFFPLCSLQVYFGNIFRLCIWMT